jgi:hypothetical protein
VKRKDETEEAYKERDRERSKAFYRKNRERRLAYYKNRYWTDPEFRERQAEYARNYNAQHPGQAAKWRAKQSPEHLAAINRRKYENHREARLAYAREYNLRDPRIGLRGMAVRISTLPEDLQTVGRLIHETRKELQRKGHRAY